MFNYKLISKKEYNDLKSEICELKKANKSLKNDIFEVKKYYRDMDYYVTKAKSIFHEDQILHIENCELFEKFNCLIDFIHKIKYLLKSVDIEYIYNEIDKIKNKYNTPLYDKIKEFKIKKFEFINL